MNTTIQVEKDTKALLDLVKKSYNAKTYNEAIKALAHAKMRNSMYGACAAEARKYPLKKLLSEVRDKSDRF